MNFKKEFKKIYKQNSKNHKKRMIILYFFINLLFHYFPDELALFKMMSWACSRIVSARSITQYYLLIFLFLFSR